MKPFSTLTRMAKIQRFRNLARSALDTYGLADARFRFLTQAGNVLFRVYESAPDLPGAGDDPFIPGQYLLRIHDRSEQKADAIELEMAWLNAIRKDTGLPVPEPVQAPDGRFLVQVSDPGIPAKRDCTLLRWLRGRFITKNIHPHHFKAQGEIMAQLHNHASKWSVPKGLTKRSFDYDGLFCDDVGAGLPNSEAWVLLSDRHKRAYEAVSRKVKRVMDNWGKGRDVYGLIHGDCGVDANVLFWKGRAHIIDFDGSGFGYYLYDLAIALEHCWNEPGYAQYLNAFIQGYTTFRALTAEQLACIDLFRSAFYVYMGLWTVAVDQTSPDSPYKTDRHEKWLDYGLEFIERFLDGRGGSEGTY